MECVSGRRVAEGLCRALKVYKPQTLQGYPSISNALAGPSRYFHASSAPPRAASASSSGTVRSRSLPPTSIPSTEAESSVARGTRYEHLCASVLHTTFGMDLTRSGGAGDRGIDLRGWWTPPPLSNSLEAPRRIRVVAQCKCQDEGGKKMGPVLVREVEGVVFRASAPSQAVETGRDEGLEEKGDGGKVAGVILSSSGFSKQALLQVRSSSVPLAAMHVLAQPYTEVAKTEAEGVEEQRLVERCVSIVWNDKFEGLLEGGLEVKWVRPLTPNVSAMGGSLGRPVIYRAGKPLR